MNNQEQKELAEQIQEAVGGLHETVTQIVDKFFRIERELKQCRNELCLKCGNYREAHNGACDDCRYRHGGEWSVDLNEQHRP